MTDTRETTPRTAARPAARQAGTPAAQWWKAWVLLSSVATTLLGWIAFTDAAPTSMPEPVSPAPVRTEVAAVPRVVVVEVSAPVPERVRALPAMPQKPVFQAPVTRTRRS